MINNIFFILVIAFMFTIVLNFSLTKSKKINKTNEIVYKYFTYFNFSLMIHLFGLILQIMYSKTSIPLIYFDYITYVGNSFSSIFLLCVSIAYSNLNNAKEINVKKLLYQIADINSVKSIIINNIDELKNILNYKYLLIMQKLLRVIKL